MEWDHRSPRLGGVDDATQGRWGGVSCPVEYCAMMVLCGVTIVVELKEAPCDAVLTQDGWRRRNVQHETSELDKQEAHLRNKPELA